MPKLSFLHVVVLPFCPVMRVVPKESVRLTEPSDPRVVPNESVRHELPLLSRVVPNESVRYEFPLLSRVVPNESVRYELPLSQRVVPNESVRHVSAWALTDNPANALDSTAIKITWCLFIVNDVLWRWCTGTLITCLEISHAVRWLGYFIAWLLPRFGFRLNSLPPL